MRSVTRSLLLLPLLASVPAPAAGQNAILQQQVDALAEAVNEQVVAWRRDIHANPELGMQEFRTAGIAADHLESLGMEVRRGIANTGVVGILRGGRPGPVVALRADMDALPVTEQSGLPFASTVTTMWQGREVGVMHACGHDNHVAILMGVASVLAEMREELPGTVMFLFQPAEEGPGGAEPMLAEGVFDELTPDAVFGLHAWPEPVGDILYRPGGMMASSDGLRIVVRGVQTHGSQPWRGVDPITAAAQIVVGLQTVVSRQIDLTDSPAVVTIGQIEGGNRGNIIPDSVVMVGTVRTLSAGNRTAVHDKIRQVATSIAGSMGATADVDINLGYPVTANDPSLTQRMEGSLRRVAGDGAKVTAPIMGAEDFSYFAQQVPGLFLLLGVTPPEDPSLGHPNHSPLFYADERALIIGVRALASLTVDFMSGQPIS